MNADQSDNAPKYRLRFLLQEFDLPYGETLIGRGEECHITIFDPAISRRHACITVDGERAIIEDLGSRNGCRVNGAYIRRRTELSDGDRIRIGTQELVFCDMLETSQVHHRQTGSLCYCGSCRAAYPKELDACPHCGSNLRGRTSQAPDPADDTAPGSPRMDRTSAPPTR